MHRVATVFTASLLIALPGVSNAEGDCVARYANQRVTLIVPYAAGGGYDSYARAFASIFAEQTSARVAVSNATAADGYAGVKIVAEANDEGRTIGFFSTTRVFGRDDGFDPNSVLTLGAVYVDGSAWFGRPGTTVFDLAGTDIVAASTSPSTGLVRAALPGKAIGSKVSLVNGYEGSGEMIAAVLRGEVDYSTRSIESTLEQVKTGDTAILMTLTRKQVDGTDAPYLAGPGGVVEQLFADKSQAERDEANRLAELTVDLNDHIRAFWVSAKLSDEERACTATLVQNVIASEDYAAAVAAVELPHDPMTVDEAQAIIERMGAAFAVSEQVLKDLRQEIE